MKRSISTAALTLVACGVLAAPVGKSEALQKAQAFLEGINPAATIQAPSISRKAKVAAATQQPYYIFNADDNQGFVIVSGDTRSEEIIGYSDKGSIDVDNMPEGLQFFLDTFESDLKLLDEQGITESHDAQIVSNSRRKSMEQTRKPVAPLIQTFWTQGSPFRDMIYGVDRVGCQNTATAQLLYYWHCDEVFQPVTGVPTAVSETGTLEPTTFDLENDVLKSYRQDGAYATERQKQEIARYMMYEYYSMHGTSAQSVVKYSASHWGLTGGSVVYRNKYFPDDFERLIYNDVSHGLPVWLQGHSESSPIPNHIFLIDGYSYDDFFHVNWGWEGICDGYFRMGPLNAYNWSTDLNWAQNIHAIIGLRSKNLEGYSNRQPDDIASLGLVDYSFTDNSNGLLYNDTTINLQSNNLALRLKLGNWSNQLGVSQTRVFETEMALYDMDLNKVGTLGKQRSAYGQNGTKVLRWPLKGLQLPDGEYYLVSKSKDIHSAGDYHFDYVKGMYCYAKAVVSGNQLSLSLVKALTIDDYEIVGKKLPGYRSVIKFHATNHSFNQLSWNLSLYKNKVSTTAGPQQDSDELRLQAMSSGEISLEFKADAKPCTLILYNKDVATAGTSDPYYAEIPFDPADYSASTATNDDLTFTWSLKNSSGGQNSTRGQTYTYTDGASFTVYKHFTGGKVYGNEIGGTVTITNNNSSQTFEDLLTIQIYFTRTNYNNRYKSANILVPVKLAPKASTTVDLSGFWYSDGAFDTEKTLTFRVYDGTLIPDATNAWFADASWTVTKSFNYWDKDGNLTCASSVPSQVPDAAAVSFKGMTISSWTTIKPNSNPNCIYYFDSESQAKRLKNYQNYNVVVGDEALNDITFNENYHVYIPFGFTAENVSYTRKMTNAHLAESEDMSWSTICLPFDVQTITSNNVAMEVGTDVELRKFFGEEYNTVYFDEAEQMEACTPYLIRVSEDKQNQQMTFAATNVEVSASLPVTDGNNFNFVGSSMLGKKEAGKFVYAIDNSGNKFNYTASPSVKPFYGYMTAESKLVDEIVIYERGYVTTDPDAQNENYHRFPAIAFEYGSLPYEVPAWDEVIVNSVAHTRLQSLNKIEDGDILVPARTVTNRAWSTANHATYDDIVFASFSNKNDNIIINGTTVTVSTLTYGEACDLLGYEIAEADRDVKVFDFYTPKSAAEFNVPDRLDVTEGPNDGRIFVVEEIGAGTYHNYLPASPNIIGAVTTITIPASVKSIGHGAFHNVGSVKKVVFEADAQTTFIAHEAFETCLNLEEINIPASVEEIEGTAFGGCASLKKIVFEGEVAPRMSRDIVEGGYNNYYAYDPFECSKRFAGRSADVTRNKCVIYVPTHAVGNYRHNDDLWADFIFAMPFTPTAERVSFTSDVPFTAYQFDGSSWVKSNHKAYYVSTNGIRNNSVTLTTLANRTAPAGFGVVLYATPNETLDIFFKPVSEATTNLTCENNLMKGILEPKIQMSTLVEAHPENNYYVVKTGNFKQVLSGNMSFGKAYLEVPVSKLNSRASVMGMFIDEDGTQSVRFSGLDEQESNVFYDIQGRRVDNPTKGLYIQNGKKRVIK